MKWDTMMRTTGRKSWREGCLSGKFKRGVEITEDDLRRMREKLLAQVQRTVHLSERR